MSDKCETCKHGILIERYRRGECNYHPRPCFDCVHNTNLKDHYESKEPSPKPPWREVPFRMHCGYKKYYNAERDSWGTLGSACHPICGYKFADGTIHEHDHFLCDDMDCRHTTVYNTDDLSGYTVEWATHVLFATGTEEA